MMEVELMLLFRKMLMGMFESVCLLMMVCSVLEYVVSVFLGFVSVVLFFGC